MALLKIEMGNELLAVVKYNGGVFSIDSNANQKNIVITLIKGLELPLFYISESQGNSWKLFEKNNQPLGHLRNPYFYQDY